VVDLGNRMVALNRTTGAILWMTELPRPQRKRDIAYAGPVLAGGALYAISSDGRMAIVDPATGALQGDRVVVGAAYVQPIVANGQMIVVSDAGEITALR
jgi:outer membrane protein assembly factor BamB